MRYISRGENAEKCAAKTEDSETVSVADAEAEAEAEAPHVDITIPTLADICYDFNGSLGFAVGSSGFIFSMYFPNWLPYFRYGSLAWIWGCVAYSVPLLSKWKPKGGCPDSAKEKIACPWRIGEFGEFLCYVFYVIGCVMGGFFHEESVEEYLPVINHMFVYGSFSLALEPLYRVLLFFTQSSIRFSHKIAAKLTESPSPLTLPSIHADNSSNNNNNNESSQSPLKLKLRLDRCLELLAIIFFCAAGLFGGFPPHPSLALPGVYFWGVGSLLCVARSFLMLYDRNQVLKAEGTTSSTS